MQHSQMELHFKLQLLSLSLLTSDQAFMQIITRSCTAPHLSTSLSVLFTVGTHILKTAPELAHARSQDAFVYFDLLLPHAPDPPPGLPL